MEAIQIMSGLSFVAWVGGVFGSRGADRANGNHGEYERIGDRNYLVNVFGQTALNKSRLGRPEEALEIVANARRIGREEDIGDQIRLDWPRRMRERGTASRPRPGRRSNPRGSRQREPG